MIDYKIYSVILCFFSIIIIGCESKKPVEDLVIHRFENEFYNSNEENLKLLVNKYPYLFPEQYSMETWKSFLKDSTRLRIYDKSSRIFNNFEVISKEILEVFIKLEGIFPEFKRPKVITLNNQSEYDDRVIYADSLLLISLDSYLGRSFYPELPEYISLNMSKEYISNDIAEKISQSFVYKPNDRSLLAEMIYHGKILFLNEYLTPFNKNHIKFHSNMSKIKWAEENEYNIWSFFVENDFLFSTRNDLKPRFIYFSPFSKFNLDIDKDSPGSIGKWLGYKIVNSYMKNNDVGLNQLIKEDFYKIFNKSKYKPNK